MQKNFRTYLLVMVLTSTNSACSSSGDSCDDLVGNITSTETTITGIESVALFKWDSSANAMQAVDQVNGTEFSKLNIALEFSWIEEQHRFRAPSTILQSLLDWFIPTANACSLEPYYEYYEPGIASIEIYSDTDLNDSFVAGTNLGSVVAVTDLMGLNSNLQDAIDNTGLLSSRTYDITPAYIGGVLATTPITPRSHVFTIMVTLSDGQAFEVRTPEVLLSGV